MALEVLGGGPGQGLHVVLGSENGHPFIRTPTWSYENSGGLGEAVGLASLLLCMRILWCHVSFPPSQA